MKKRRLFYIILAILIFGLLGWWYWKPKASEQSGTKRPVMATGGVAGNLSSSADLSQSNSGTQTQPSPEEMQALLDRPDITPEDKQKFQDNPALALKTIRYYENLEAPNYKTINVYGKVIDQYGQPVAGAEVKGGTLLIITPNESGSQEYTTKTDAQGRFSFTGLQGARFGLGVEKPGYEFDQSLYTEWWDSYKPDPNNPMIFKMWKLQGAEQMMHQNFHVSIPCDGTPIDVNFVTGKIVANGGDMVITFTRNPVQIVRGTPFEWTLTLQVPDGGLVEIHDAYANEAPESGYQETVTLGTGPAPKKYINSAEQNYYFKSASGKYYGRVRIKLQADFQPPPTFLQIEAYVNLAGSRNLEYDRTQDPTAPKLLP
jgi:hypothetical protein